jgi:hypothetical protein
MSDATILAIVTAVCTCVITCVTIWARTRPGAMFEEVKSLRSTIDQMHNTIVGQNATISRQDAQWQGKGGDTHKFTQAERDKAAGIKP